MIDREIQVNYRYIISELELLDGLKDETILKCKRQALIDFTNDYNILKVFSIHILENVTRETYTGRVYYNIHIIASIDKE